MHRVARIFGRIGLILALGVLLCLRTAFVQAGEAFIPPKYPWHLADVWWRCTAPNADVREISIDFSIAGEIADSVELYVAPLGLIKLNATSFYGGLQTSISGWPSKTFRTRQRIGRGGIFSRWSTDNTPIALDYADGGPDTHYEAADYEKNFISVRRKIEWRGGQYTYVVRRVGQGTDAGTPYAWFGAFIVDRSTGKETPVGSLRLDGAEFRLGSAMAAFVEVYGTRSSIPKITVAFSEPRIDRRTCASSRTRSIYPSHGIPNAPRFATSALVGDAAVVTTHPAGIRDGVASEILH